MNYEKYAKYGISLCTSKNNGVEYYMVTLTFGRKWAVRMPENSDQKVLCAKISEDGTYCYMTETCNGLEPVFELIDTTISYNEELEKKVELLKVKAEELKDIFASRSYEELLRLRFVIETLQEPSEPKTKRQSNSRKKTSQKPNAVVTETNNEKGVCQEEEMPSEPVQGEFKEIETESVLVSVDGGLSDIDKKIAKAVANKK